MTVHHVGSADIGTVDVDAVGAVAAHARADSGIISLNPQDGLFLRAEHLQRMQDYARDLAAAVGVSAGSGVVYGYSVALGADELQVGTGFAVDGAGRPLRSRQAVTLPLADLVHAEDRFWVLEVTAAPPRPFGKENTYGTICDDPCAASALRPWLADGVTIRLVADTMPDLDRNPESSSRRNRLASWYFERERRRGGPWLTPTAPGATVSSILQRDWAAGTDAPSGDAVPLAVLARSDGEWLLDVWTARRDIGDPHPRRAWQARLAMRPWDVFVAQVLQFQAQLAATFGSSARSSAATRSSREADELVETLIDEVLSMAIRSKKVTAAARAVRDRKSVSAVLGSPLPELGLHELPPAGFLVDGRPDDEDRLDLRAHYEAVFGGNVDVTVCGCSADAVPRMVESAQHLDRIPLGPADPRPHVLVLVPDVRADLEAVAAQAYGWVAFVRGRSLTCGDRESIEEENGPRDVGSGDVIESETTMEGAPVVTVMPRADGTNSPAPE